MSGRHMFERYKNGYYNKTIWILEEIKTFLTKNNIKFIIIRK